jgi:hypothetical protein
MLKKIEENKRVQPISFPVFNTIEDYILELEPMEEWLDESHGCTYFVCKANGVSKERYVIIQYHPILNKFSQVSFFTRELMKLFYRVVKEEVK